MNTPTAIQPPPFRGKMRAALLATALTAALCASPAHAANITLSPIRDNSIYAENNNSNALGNIFVGRTAGVSGTSIRRGLLEFDIAGNLPAGSVINSVTLTLQILGAGPAAGSDILELHPLLADWGEGTSSGTGPGALPTTNDATWNFRLFSTASWATPGGDFGPTSGTTTLGAASTATLSSQPGMVANVQNWLDTPGANFGWLMRYSNETTPSTARYFGSRESAPASRPALAIDYTVVPEPGSLTLLAIGAACALRRRRP